MAACDATVPAIGVVGIPDEGSAGRQPCWALYGPPDMNVT